MFDPCVNRTLELIDGQVAEIQKKGACVKVSHSILGSGRKKILICLAIRLCFL
jgi:hypothetical protein